MSELPLQPGQGLSEVGLGRGVVRFGPGQPAERRVRILGAGCVGGVSGHEEPDVRVLVRGFSFARRNADDDHVTDLGIGPRRQVRQAGLLTCFAGGDGQRVALPRVAVAADLQPSLLALVPAEQHPCGARVGDQRGRGDVQREIAAPRVIRGLEQRPDPPDVGRLGLALGPVTVQEHAERRRHGARFHETRW